MEAQGLVSRTEDVHDRRCFPLRATDKGEELVSNLRSQSVTFLSAILKHLNEEELNGMVKGLAAFIKSAKEQDDLEKSFSQ